MTLLLVLGIVLLACGGSASEASPKRAQNSESAQASLRCGTENPTASEIAKCGDAIHDYAGRSGLEPPGGEVAVSVHVITCGGAGAVPQSRIDAQIEELTRAFQGSGFRFRLARVEFREDCDWFRMTPQSRSEREAKQALADDPAHRLNVYTCAPCQSLLGWAYFPPTFPESDPMHGIVVHYGSLPGGTLPAFDRGRTAIHEVGHYFGLYHTFQNGCEPPGDDVSDTPYEAEPALGCPIGRNTCEAPGDDPIDDYMDYSDDTCTVRFTTGQIERMSLIVPVYRPSLLGVVVASSSLAKMEPTVPGFATRAAVEMGAEARAAGSVWLRDAAPNPASEETVLSFTIARGGGVTLRIDDARGHRVRTLLDRKLEAGTHAIPWRAHGQRAGI